MATQAKGLGENAQTKRSKSAESERFPWERQDGESIQAYARFVAYRNTPPEERSMRKLGISAQLAFRWARRWSWTKRAALHDDWLMQLGDSLAHTAQLGARLGAARLGSAFVRRSLRSIDEVKLSSVDDLVNLAQTGVKLERQALGLAEGPTALERAPAASVSVSLGFGQLGWTKGNQIEQPIEMKQNETKVVVPVGEQVIAATPRASGRPRLAERIVNCPSGKGKDKLNGE